MPGLAEALVPGAMVALADSRVEPGRAGSCGKTQLAACLAGHLWRSGQVNLLAWVDASSRASVLSGYVEAAAAVGINPAGPAEDVAARFTGWMAQTARPWLVVLDDLRDAADLDGLWPGGPAGRVLITTPDADAVTGQPRAEVMPVAALSTREATNYLMNRLADDPDQRNGAIDLAITLRGDPCALTHAGARALAGKGITVNAFAPGVVATPLWEQLDKDLMAMGVSSAPGEAMDNFSKSILLGRVAQPADVVGTVRFLASPASDYMTGQVLMIDGGMILQ